MAQDSGQEKTEQPTAKRIADSRKKGQVPRSKELATAAVLIASAVAMYIFGSAIGQSMYDVMHRLFSLKREQAFDTNQFGLMWAEVMRTIAWPLLGFICTVFVAAFLGVLLWVA